MGVLVIALIGVVISPIIQFRAFIALDFPPALAPNIAETGRKAPESFSPYIRESAKAPEDVACISMVASSLYERKFVKLNWHSMVVSPLWNYYITIIDGNQGVNCEFKKIFMIIMDRAQFLNRKMEVKFIEHESCLSI